MSRTFQHKQNKKIRQDNYDDEKVIEKTYRQKKSAQCALYRKTKNIF